MNSTASNLYLLGNSALHEQFRITTEVLGLLVSHAPRPVSIEELQSYTGRSTKELSKLCGALSRAALIQPVAKTRGSWKLECAPATVTLEDVFLCVIANHTLNAKPHSARPNGASHPQQDIDLLISQASMAINQSVFRHLREFSLDRLKFSAAARPPSRARDQNGSKFTNVHDFEVNPWFI